MPREIQVAAIQMDGAPAPVAERLKRAEKLIQDALSQGAELVVLPAAFNTGKTFLETNYELTERLSDTTMQWMCEQAQKHQIHLAGSWMLVDKDDTYNAAFLIAPDGKNWRYDGQYPYLWERVFYRDGKSITVADTSLGKIGMLIGWDAAHPEIYERYAAKVDLLLVLNDALDVQQASLQHSTMPEIQADQFGFFAKWLAQSAANYLAENIEAQANWLNVPMVCAGASGEFSSILPAPFFSVHGLLFGQPGLWDDIECSWLLYEAAEVLGDKAILNKVTPVTIQMAQATLDKGLDADGSVFNEQSGNHIDKTRHWWPQAEAIVGFWNAYQLTRDEKYKHAALNCWTYIQKQIKDLEHGEWLWGRDESGQLLQEDKAGPWKAPYHNGRMCMEMIDRI